MSKSNIKFHEGCNHKGWSSAATHFIVAIERMPKKQQKPFLRLQIGFPRLAEASVSEQLANHVSLALMQVSLKGRVFLQEI